MAHFVDDRVAQVVAIVRAVGERPRVHHAAVLVAGVVPRQRRDPASHAVLNLNSVDCAACAPLMRHALSRAKTTAQSRSACRIASASPIMGSVDVRKGRVLTRGPSSAALW